MTGSGGSDANITAAYGAPTLDGLGPRGNKAHTADEHLELPSLVERGALAAVAMHRLFSRG